MTKKKILITVGGTGGHIYPSLALAKQLNRDYEVCFIGGNLRNNPFFSRHGFPYHTVACAPLSGKNPFHYLKGAAKIVTGMGQSVRFMQRFKPNLLVGFGSYYTFPVLLAAKIQRVPIILHEANSVPGKVNRLMARFVDVTGVHFPEAASYLKGKTAFVGMPIREDFSPSQEKRDLALNYYGLDPKQKTLLVFGGSQGAKALNLLFCKATNYLENVQILHMTGNQELTKQCQNHYRTLGLKAVVKDFEARMDLAWSVADLVISRSGASTIAEQMAFAVPGIFIPYPYATDNHQEKNADFVVHTVKGGVKLREAELTPEKLAATIQKIDLQEMSQALVAHQQHNQMDLISLIRDQI